MSRKANALLIVILLAALVIAGIAIWGWMQYQTSNPSHEKDTATTATTTTQAHTIFGGWYWGTQHINFNISLKAATGTQLAGNYQTIWADGGFLDGCNVDDQGNTEDCVQGTLQGDVAHITFYSLYSQATGTATMVYDPESDTIKWTVDQKRAADSQYYVPDNVTLQRDTIDTPDAAIVAVQNFPEVKQWESYFTGPNGSSPTTGGYPAFSVSQESPSEYYVRAYENASGKTTTFGIFSVDKATGLVSPSSD